MASDVNPMIRQWMSSMTSMQIETMRPTITLTPTDVQQYIIRRSPTHRMETGSTRSSDENDDFLSADEGTDR